MPNTNVVFNADTGRWRASLESAEKSVLRTGDTVERVKGRILASYQAQVLAAREAGRSQEDLDRIQEKAAEKLASVTESNAERSEKALDRLLVKQRAVAEELNRIGNVQAKEGHGVSDRQAISGAIRLGEGTSSIRAVESFIAMSPIASRAVHSLFPLIGGAGLAGMFIDMGERAYEAFQKIKEGADSIRNSWAAINEPLMLEADNLRKANAELDITIAHLEHKPANTLALEIAETRIEVDKLAESALKASIDVKKILTENQGGFWSKAWDVVSGQADTGVADKEITKRLKDRQNASLDLQSAVRSGKFTPDEIESKRQGLANRDRENLTWANQTRTFVDSHSRDGDGDKLSAGLMGFEQFSSNMVDVSDQSQQNTAKQKIAKDLQDRKAMAEAAKQANEKAREAERKRWENEDDQLTNAGVGDPHLLAVVWDMRLRLLKAGSEQYLYAYHQFTEQNKKAGQEDATAAKQVAEKAQKSQREGWDVMHDNWQLASRHSAQDEADFWSIRVLEAEQGTENYKDALNKFTQAQAKADKEAADARLRQDQASLAAKQRRGAYDSASLNLERQQGQISPHDFALQQQTNHTSLFDAEQDALKKKLADAQANGTPAEVDAATEAIAKSNADRAVQVMQDAAEVVGTTWKGALKNSLSEWVQDAQDSAKQVTELAHQAIDGLNTNLVNAMFGDKTDWSGMFKGLGKTVASDGLKHIEGQALGALGLGKADGSKENPWHVIVDSGGAGGKGAGGIFGNFGLDGESDGDDDDDSDKSSAGGWLKGLGGIFGKLGGSLFGGGKAVGGDVQAGVTYDIGEAGREEFTPSVPGTVTPHSANGRGNAYYNVQVANGVTPEQMKMHVNEALASFHPQVVASSVAAVRDFQQRNPKH